jgi:hypothetical protein
MSKNESFEAPKPPRIPEVGEELGQLNGWEYSEDPHEGRFVDEDDECAGDCPSCK